MIAFWSCVLLVTALFNGVVSDLNAAVCTPVKTSCGLVPPTLPEDFELGGERVNFEIKTNVWEEMIFDSKNLRGKYMWLSEGVEYHYLFDYNVSQILHYIILHLGDDSTRDPLSSTCVARNMADAEENYIFGYRDGNFETKHSRMFDANRVLRFGGPYPYAFNGTGLIADRGVNTNSFFGCVYEDYIKATSAVRYNFSANNVVPAGGDLQYDIDGMESLEYESVPIGADVIGTFEKADENGTIQNIPYKTSHSFAWFKANPVYQEVDFQIPPWMHCKNYRGWKDMPKFPRAFSVRMETTGFKQDILGKKIAVDMTSVDELFYYNDKELARRDYTPTIERDYEIIQKFGNSGRLKTIYDFKTGALYIIHLATGRCYTRPISQGDFFETSKDNLFIEMAKPEELFLMEQSEMQYKGQYFFRDINCDVWSGIVHDEAINVTMTKETYMATNGWHSEADERVQLGVPVRHTIITETSEFQIVKENNFFKFKAYPPTLMLFDVSDCMEAVEHNFYAIMLTVDKDFKEDLLNYTFQFLEASQYYLANISQVLSPLRIQRIDLEPVNIKLFLTFAIVAKPKFRLNIPIQIVGVGLKEAANSIRKVVDGGNFQISFINPKTKKPLIVTANAGSFYAWFPTGRQRSAQKNVEIMDAIPFEQESSFETSSRHNWILLNDSPSKKKGMKSGAFAALAISMLLIGFAIGIAGMYFYIRKNYGSNSEINIALEKQTP